MHWGTELWDKYGDLCSHTSSGIDFLDSHVYSYIKERGKVEMEYAKNLRALIKKYTPKTSTQSLSTVKPDKNSTQSTGPVSIISINTNQEEEYSHIKAFTQVLTEVGYVAGQHEVLSETLSKETCKTIQEQIKKLKESRRKAMKDADKLNDELKKTFKTMESSREKFRKALEEQDKASGAYDRANMDGNVSRNELDKLRQYASTKSSHCDTLKCKFASVLLKTNDFQSKYYYEHLPQVLNHLQEIDKARITLMRDALMSVVMKERQVNPIIVGCYDSISKALESIDSEGDTHIVIERLKSGDVPPGDFKFEDMRDPQAMLRHEALADNRATNLNLYPKKRELQKQISGIEKELRKCEKEMISFQKMEEVYRNNPKFGNSNELRNEMEKGKVKIHEFKTALTQLQSELSAVETKLESLRPSRSPNPTMRSGSSGSPDGFMRSGSRSGSSNGSFKSSNLSIGSSAMASSNQIVYDIPENSYNSQVDHDFDPDEWADDFDDVPPPPPPPPLPTSDIGSSSSPSVISSSSMSTTGSSSLSSTSSRRCIAMYDYTDRCSMQDCNLPMEVGEELELVEEDCEGWTKVRRILQRPDEINEGYVPTSYLRII